MTHTRHRRVLTTLVATATCMALATAPASAVSGGRTLDTAAQPFLAKIDVGTERSGVSCSGALVAPQWLATAGSCFADSPERPGAPRAETTATIGGGSLSDSSGQVRQVDRLVPRGDRDLMLARLDEPVSGITPVAMATSQPNSGDTLRASGYGRTTETWVPDQPHTGDFTVQSVQTGMVDIQGAAPRPASARETPADRSCAPPPTASHWWEWPAVPGSTGVWAKPPTSEAPPPPAPTTSPPGSVHRR